MRSPSLHNRHCVSRFQVSCLLNDCSVSHTGKFLDGQKVQVKTYYACLRMCKFRTVFGVRVRLKRDGTRAETRFRLSPKRTSPFKSAGLSVQSTAGSRGVRISVSNAGYTTFRGSVRILAAHSIRQFPLHFPSRASPCAIRFQTHSTPFFLLELALAYCMTA